MSQKLFFLSKNQSLLYRILFFSLMFMYVDLIARESDDGVEQIRIGNFAVPGTTQPFPVLGFGQTVIDQYNTLGFLLFDREPGKRQNFNEITPGVLYGVRDDLSILLAFPTAVKFQQDGYRSSGSLDLVMQMEYALYGNHKPTYVNQISLVGLVSLPTGNECKIPATGDGSPSFFGGVVFLHLATEWYTYAAFAGILTTKNDSGIKPGNQFLYQAGIGKNIAYASEKWIFMWMLEFNGLYEKKSKINGIIDNNSGSNSIILGPALHFATKTFVLQAGVSPVVYQNRFGEQLKSSCVISLNMAYRFS